MLLQPVVARSLHIKSEVHDIAVLYDVVFTFDTYFAGLATGGLTTEGNVVGIFDDLGAYEAAFEIGVYHTCALRSLLSVAKCPSAHFVASGRQVCAATTITSAPSLLTASRTAST